MKFTKKLITLQILLYTIMSNFSIVYADNFTYKPVDDSNIETNAESIVVMDADTNVVMYAKNPQKMEYPASTTKIMTALLLIEYVEDGNATYQDEIPFSEEAVYAVPSDGTNIGQQPNTTLTIEQALYALMLPSANEVANAIGEYLAGSMDAFGEMMTERANELGCTGTNFTCASGLHDDNHYTTALDMALIMDKACEYPKFIEVSSTPSYSFERTNSDGTTEEVDMVNSNKLIQKSSEYYNDDVVCGKTGYTSKAQHTLVTYSEVNGHHIIISVYNANKSMPFVDTTNLLRVFKDSYHDITLSEFSQYDTADVYDTETDEAFSEVTVKSSPVTISVPESVSSYDFENFTFNYPSKLYAPLEENAKVGTCDFTLNDSFTVSSDVLTVHSVDEKAMSIFVLVFNIFKFLLIGIVYIVCIGLAVILPIRYYNLYKYKKRKAKRLGKTNKNERKVKRNRTNNKNNRPKKNSRENPKENTYRYNTNNINNINKKKNKPKNNRNL